MNPYLSRVMLEDPSQFFGRTRELRYLFSRMGALHPQCVSVVGERRIGKSSLLNAVTWREMQERHSGPQSLPLVVFLDFQRHPNLHPERFFQLLAEEVRRHCPQLELESNAPTYEILPRTLQALQSSGRGLVALLDEFDLVTANAAFGAEFYAYLRSAANSFPVAYVTSSRIELGQMCCSSDIADSPFFNIFSNLYLRPFLEDEALELIRRPSLQEGLPLEPYTPQLKSLAGRFPFYLQIACCLYFDVLSEHPGLEPDHEEMQERFLEESSPHFDYFWDHSDESVRRLLENLVRGESIRPEDQHTSRKLQRDGYLHEIDDGLQPFSAAFCEYIRRRRSRDKDGASGTINLGPAVARFSSGEMIHQYRLMERAGEGGMGIVYAAEDTLLRRKVALKICRPELVDNQSLQKRILREAQVLASLAHPSIVAVHELFELGDKIVMVMEWVEGRNLERVLVEDGVLPWREATGMILQAAEGLDAAHRRGVIHRDIKSANLMVAPQGQVRLTDFGLARGREDLFAPLTMTGALMGTLVYMSPEQVLGREVDYRSDLFSLGTVFFECLTGQLPFRRDSIPETLDAIVKEPTPSLSTYGLECAERLDPVIAQLTAKTPESRYQSAADLCDDLRRLLAGRSRKIQWLRFFGSDE